jgi:UDP-N-acetylmuramate--alanine ligase
MKQSVVKPQNIYCLGIKGVGMTMLAQFLKKQGHHVSGSDTTEVFMTDKVLRAAKIKVLAPFRSANLPADADLIIYSSAYNAGNNPELAALQDDPSRFKKIRVLSYATALGEIFNQHYGIAVCGSHGKTTTAAWLGYVLWQAGKRPSVLVGSRVPQFFGSSLSGASPYLVAEVDEYQNKLQYFQPRGVVLNNIDYDHPDFFPTRSAYARVFADFVKKIPASGFLIINNSDAEIKKIKRHCRGKIISYEINSRSVTAPASHKNHNLYAASDLKQAGAYQIFRARFGKKDLGEFKIRLLGRHNVLNALAVIAAARELKTPLAMIKKHLAGFRGTERRAQILGRYKGAMIIDDYAHHPTEIKVTLAGLRTKWPRRRLITVFHPHTFTRTKALFKDFAGSFGAVDELIILDIYGSAREKHGGVSSRELAAAVENFNRRKKIQQAVRHIPTRPRATAYLRRRLRRGDILLLMGAGDVFRLGEDLLK